jgi:hypothetical protein
VNKVIKVIRVVIKVIMEVGLVILLEIMMSFYFKTAYDGNVIKNYLIAFDTVGNGTSDYIYR